MQKTESIAILLATYNGEKYLTAQLDSLLAQTYTDWVCYIHDDGSKDSTADVISSYCTRYPDKFISISGAPTGGSGSNFMYLLSQVVAPYYMMCDQDDVWLNFKVKKSYDTIKSLESYYGDMSPILCYSEVEVVDDELREICPTLSKFQQVDLHKNEFGRIMIQNVVTGCTTIFNRELVKKALKVKHKENIIMHDWWLALIARKFGTLQPMDEVTMLYRQHGDNQVGAKNAGSFQYYIDKLFTNGSVKYELERTRKQALEFAYTYDLPKSDLSYEYGRLKSRNKLRRLGFYYRNGVVKQGIKRNIGLIIYG